MIQTSIQVRFADVDLAGHIHNAAYLHYFESGRINFFVSQLGQEWDWKKDGLIIKKNAVLYHQPGRLEDQITISVGCCHIGNTSFTLTYTVKNHKDQILVEGESVVVCMDYTTGKKVIIPNQIKKTLENHPSKPVQA